MKIKKINDYKNIPTVCTDILNFIFLNIYYLYTKKVSNVYFYNLPFHFIECLHMYFTLDIENIDNFEYLILFYSSYWMYIVLL